MIVAGPTGVGKTHFAIRLLKHAKTMYGEADAPVRTFYFYGVYQDRFDTLEDEIEGLSLRQGLPPRDFFDGLDRSEHCCLVLDDLLVDAVNSKDVAEIFTRGCHHYNLSLMYLVQNVLQQGKMARLIALNTSYMVLFRQPGDYAQFAYLGRQMYPFAPQRFLECYTHAVSRPHGYLFVDNLPSTEENDRLASNILPDEADDLTLYCPL